MILRRGSIFRIFVVLLGAVAAAGVLAPVSAARTMLVGVDDDWVKWRNDTEGIVHIQRNVGLRTVKVMFPWRRGMWHPRRTERHYIYRLAQMSSLEQRVVLAFAGPAGQAPRTPAARQQFCSYVREVVAQVPAVVDVVIWNEVNSPSFWRPQRRAPAEYAALLARCWDLLHAARPGINVITSTAPRHQPITFLRALGAAYAKSGRTRPIADSFGHNPYPAHSAEPPWVRHTDGMIGQGDYETLVGALREAFAGTPQAPPGELGVTLWYLETGFQTRTPFGAPLYFGRETDRAPIPALSPLASTSASVVDQASQLRDALELAYCHQPAVGAFFNFQLADERRLGGWQSGLLWANWRPKPSAGPVRDAISAITRGELSCG